MAPGQTPKDLQRARTDALMERVARGDESAFTQLYDLTIDAVYGIARRVLRNPAMAEDVAQQVMVEVWRLAPRFDRATGSAMTFVLTIAHRRAVDHVRRESAHARRTDRFAAQAGTAADVVDETVLDDLDRARVTRALASLTPLQRESVDLAFTGGYTHVEIAAILEVPLGTVKTRIRDGLIRLRDELGEGFDTARDTAGVW